VQKQRIKFCCQREVVWYDQRFVRLRHSPHRVDQIFLKPHKGDEETLKRALAAIGPLAIAVNSQHESFYYYSEGVYSDPECTDRADHAVLLVGYGTDNSTSPPKDYWLIKNSWSTDWGEAGYLRLERGTNRCRILDYVAYPVV
jgi:C1A family cysteine protease